MYPLSYLTLTSFCPLPPPKKNIKLFWIWSVIFTNLWHWTLLIFTYPSHFWPCPSFDPPPKKREKLHCFGFGVYPPPTLTLPYMWHWPLPSGERPRTIGLLVLFWVLVLISKEPVLDMTRWKEMPSLIKSCVCFRGARQPFYAIVTIVSNWQVAKSAIAPPNLPYDLIKQNLRQTNSQAGLKLLLRFIPVDIIYCNCCSAVFI